MRAKENSASFRFLLPIELPQELLCLFHVIESEFSRFNQVRHHRLRTPAKERQQNRRSVSAAHRREKPSPQHVEISDLPRAPNRLLDLQPYTTVCTVVYAGRPFAGNDSCISRIEACGTRHNTSITLSSSFVNFGFVIP